jgi:hypothetical protein
MKHSHQVAKIDGLTRTTSSEAASKAVQVAIRGLLSATLLILAVGAISVQTQAAGSSGWPHPEFQVEHCPKSNGSAPAGNTSVRFPRANIAVSRQHDNRMTGAGAARIAGE